MWLDLVVAFANAKLWPVAENLSSGEQFPLCGSLWINRGLKEKCDS